jgi:hypothetical protein
MKGLPFKETDMMRNLRALVLCGVAVALPAQAQSPAVGAAAPAAEKPAPAATAPKGKVKGPPKFDVKLASCEAFLGLRPEVRGLVTAWTAGRSTWLRRGNRWALDADGIQKLAADVEDQCKKASQASYIYKVEGEVAKAR